MRWSSLCCLFLMGCLAPPQNFPKDSELWSKANAPLNAASQISGNMAKHKVIVAVVDTGIDYNHPGLARSLRWAKGAHGNQGVGHDLLGKDLLPYFTVINPEDGTDVSDDLQVKEHATHVSGLATLGGVFGKPKRDFGPLIGLVPIRALPMTKNYPRPTGNEKTDSSIEAIRLVASGLALAHMEGASIVNLSLGAELTLAPEEFYPMLKRQIERQVMNNLNTKWKDMLLVAAAGNESKVLLDSLSSFPATLESPNVLCVGAMADTTNIADFSNRGSLVDIYVRGQDINSIVPGNARAKLSGTSMATPLITNLAAKVKLLAPRLGAVEIKELILKNADNLKVGEETIKVANFKRTLEAAQLVR